MQSGPFSAGDSRTLLIDVNIEHGRQLAEQINRAGFRTDLAMSWGAARAVLAVNYYHSCIIVADLHRPTDLARLEELRGVAPRVWTIVLCDMQSEQALDTTLPPGADALMSAPLSLHELASRLAEFASHARPAS